VEGPERLSAAADVGADVTFFLTGGTALMTGAGEKVERLDPLEGFVVVVAVPEFEASTPEVYRRWDEMNGPAGSVVPARRLPPGLREVEVVNDHGVSRLDR
jgi:4-diphosphocytidyl-2-C-methyl-D-erythritol kinase